MNREAQAMMVTLLLSSWVGQKGPNAIIGDAALINLFDLSERILLMSDTRWRKREAELAAEQGPIPEPKG